MASSRRTGTNESRWTGSAWASGVNTFGTAGAGRDYTSMGTWEADTDVDIVTAAVSPVLECYDYASSYALAATIGGATASATYMRIIRAASTSRHLGVPGAGVKFTNSTSAQAFGLSEPYLKLQDFESVVTSNGASNNMLVAISDGTGNEVVGVIGTP